MTIKNDADIDGTLTLGSLSDVESSIGTNTSNISTNASNISTNSSAITSNDTDIATNATNISSNDSDISTLQTVTSNITSGARLYQGSFNTAVGANSLTSLTSARYYNTALGYNAMNNTTEGENNVGLGTTHCIQTQLVTQILLLEQALYTQTLLVHIT